ncbi:MAG TPA: aminopeptidase P family N-terminal domain-containing protein, partial [bacterium]|nr:aminopeptidase P family N-terminal domain-containing protein [bacterium]
MKKETEVKWARIKELLSEKNLEGIIINKISNFAWFTGGGNNFVALNTENGVCSLLLTENKIYLLTDNIEAGRIKQEEITDIPVDDIIWPW